MVSRELVLDGSKGGSILQLDFDIVLFIWFISLSFRKLETIEYFVTCNSF
uniref:Uncharacterized protein n=1 Tax=Fagus sylvatica TaxID=28930 RepID=A0A2N9GUL8_FAGSY